MANMTNHADMANQTDSTDTMNNCVFCKIINRELPSYTIYEDREFIVFLDIFPATIGQTLVIPKKHLDYAFDLDESRYIKMMSLAKGVAKAIDKALKPVKTALIIEGFDVAHAHVRLHPCYEKRLIVVRMDPKPSDDEFKMIAQKIKANLSAY